MKQIIFPSLSVVVISVMVIVSEPPQHPQAFDTAQVDQMRARSAMREVKKSLSQQVADLDVDISNGVARSATNREFSELNVKIRERLRLRRMIRIIDDVISGRGNWKSVLLELQKLREKYIRELSDYTGRGNAEIEKKMAAIDLTLTTITLLEAYLSAGGS